jgi:hypothetical protein
MRLAGVTGGSRRADVHLSGRCSSSSSSPAGNVSTPSII